MDDIAERHLHTDIGPSFQAPLFYLILHVLSVVLLISPYLQLLIWVSLTF